LIVAGVIIFKRRKSSQEEAEGETGMDTGDDENGIDSADEEVGLNKADREPESGEL
jgi:hypothetical protein